MEQLIIFEARNEHYALSCEVVVAIFRAVEVTTIPELAAPFAGVINYRGEIVPVIRFNRVLGEDVTVPSLSEHMVILRLNGTEKVCLWVEKVVDFCEVNELRPLANFANGSLKARFSSELARLESGLVPVIRVESLFQSGESVTGMAEVSNILVLSEN